MPFLKNIVFLSHREEPAPKQFSRYDDLMKKLIVDESMEHDLDDAMEMNQFDDPINIQFTSV
jgi:hypothetical protein